MSKTFKGVPPVATPNTAFIRQKLRETMVLGMPESDTEKPTFYFDRVADWAKHDREGNPYDWTVAPDTESQQAPVQVICAYEFFSPLGRQGSFITEVGEFNPTSVVFTMFEDEYASVFGADHVTIGASSQKWYFRFWRPTYAIVDMDAYQVHFQAEGND